MFTNIMSLHQLHKVLVCFIPLTQVLSGYIYQLYVEAPTELRSMTLFFPTTFAAMQVTTPIRHTTGNHLVMDQTLINVHKSPYRNVYNQFLLIAKML